MEQENRKKKPPEGGFSTFQALAEPHRSLIERFFRVGWYPGSTEHRKRLVARLKRSCELLAQNLKPVNYPCWVVFPPRATGSKSGQVPCCWVQHSNTFKHSNTWFFASCCFCKGNQTLPTSTTRSSRRRAWWFLLGPWRVHSLLRCDRSSVAFFGHSGGTAALTPNPLAG